MKPTPMNIQFQHGAALITALSILLILTVLGISAMSTSALQERMAGNARDYEVAFEAAESALRAAEQSLATSYATLNFDTVGGTNLNLFSKDTTTEQWKDDTLWSSYPSVTLTVGSAKYVIQQLDTTIIDTSAVESSSLEAHSYDNRETLVGADVGVFQITVRGFGLSTNSRVMLQSNYGVLNP